MTKVGVFGGSGFVGSNIASLLMKQNVSFHNFDILPSHLPISQSEVDIETVGAHTDLLGCSVLINLAAMHRDDVRPLRRYTEVNVDGARNLCEAAKANNVTQIIFTSSVAIYGFAPANTGEDGAPNYFNEYGKTKYLAEQVYIDWQREDPKNRSLTIIRPTVIFGPGNRGNVYNLLKQIASNRFVMFGDGQNVKSMAYVENVAGFAVHCLDAEPGVYTYNYVDKPDLNMSELVSIAKGKLFGRRYAGVRLPAFLGVSIGWGFDLMAWLLGKRLPISSIRVKKFMATTQFSSAAMETGFKAPYTLAEGLEKTLGYEFLEDNRDKPTYETE